MTITSVHDQIDLMDARTWVNRHLTVSQKVSGIYDIRNPDIDDKLAAYNKTTESFQWLIKRAVRDKKRLHPLGSGWSLTPVCVSKDYLVNTRQLRLRFRIKKDSIASGYKGNKNGLCFIQCGNTVTRLNRYLRANNKSLQTSGSSNGQTIAGALSTGTHGSIFNFGGIQEFVVGLHIVVSSTRHIWLERKSYPVTKASFVKNLGAERIQDDELFNAAVVSLGGFGFIHGVMIETVPRFLIEAYRVWLPYDDALKKAMATLDFSDLTLPHPAAENKNLFHFELVFNPNEKIKQSYAQIMYKRRFRHDYPHLEREIDEPGLGDGALSIIGNILDRLPSTLTKPAITKSFESEYAEYGPKWGTVGEIFSSELVRGKTLSAAMAVPLPLAEKALGAAISAYKEHDDLFAGLISLRYVKGTDALLGFTHFEQTAVLEVDGIYSKKGLSFLKKVWKKLDKNNIPFATHWGKINDINPQQVQKMYGDTKITKWKTARENLLDAETRAVFTNDFLEQAGLSS